MDNNVRKNTRELEFCPCTKFSFTCLTVMWRLSRSISKSRFFLGKSNGIDTAIFGASVTRFRHRITLDGPAISAGSHRVGFTPPQGKSNHAECRRVYLHKSDHAECRGVYIFNSKYWGKKIEIRSKSTIFL